jgi:hypothetical protein
MPDALHDRLELGNMAAMLYSKRSNQDKFYAESSSLGGLKLPTIPVPGYIGITRGIDRLEIGCSPAFGRNTNSYDIPTTPSLRTTRSAPKHTQGEKSFGIDEGFKEHDANRSAPFDRSDKARWLRRMERISGVGKAPPHLPALDGKQTKPIDFYFKNTKDFNAYRMFPPVAPTSKVRAWQSSVEFYSHVRCFLEACVTFDSSVELSLRALSAVSELRLLYPQLHTKQFSSKWCENAVRIKKRSFRSKICPHHFGHVGFEFIYRSVTLPSYAS